MIRWFLITVLVAVFAEAVVKLPLRKHRSTIVKRQTRDISPKLVKNSNGFSLPYKNDYFTVGIQLGTPPQFFEPVLDMINRNLSILEWDFTPLTHEQNVYDPKASSTSKYNNYSWFQQYDKEFYFTAFDSSDLLTINEEISYPTQVFGAIYRSYEYPDIRNEFPIDGILGFGIPAPKSNETSSPSLNLLKNLKNPVYSVYIQRHVSPSLGTVGGQLTLGDYDRENCDKFRSKTLPLFKGPNWYYNWIFIIQSVRIGNFSRLVDRETYANVGQPTLSLPKAEFNGLMKQINWTYTDGLYIVDCDKDAPVIQLSIQGHTLTINDDNYIIDMDLGNNKCVLAVEEGFDDTENVLGLGIPFIEKYCVSINVIDHHINIAPVLDSL